MIVVGLCSVNSSSDLQVREGKGWWEGEREGEEETEGGERERERGSCGGALFCE